MCKGIRLAYSSRALSSSLCHRVVRAAVAAAEQSASQSQSKRSPNGESVLSHSTAGSAYPSEYICSTVRFPVITAFSVSLVPCTKYTPSSDTPLSLIRVYMPAASILYALQQVHVTRSQFYIVCIAIRAAWFDVFFFFCSLIKGGEGKRVGNFLSAKLITVCTADNKI